MASVDDEYDKFYGPARCWECGEYYEIDGHHDPCTIGDEEEMQDG